MIEPEPFDLARLGQAVLNSLVASQQMGHSSPAQSVVYMQADGPEAALLRDYLSVCARTDPGATARLAAFTEEQGLADKIAQVVTR